jgi:hypothetical protein
MYFFRTFKKSTVPYKVHNMGLRYIKSTFTVWVEFCPAQKSSLSSSLWIGHNPILVFMRGLYSTPPLQRLHKSGTYIFLIQPSYYI